MKKDIYNDFDLEIINSDFEGHVITKNNRFFFNKKTYLSEIIKAVVEKEKLKEKEDDEIVDNIVAYANILLRSMKSTSFDYKINDIEIILYKEEKLKCIINIWKYSFTIDIIFRLPVVKIKNK